MGGWNSRPLLDYEKAVSLLGEQEVAKILEGFNRLSVGGVLSLSEFKTGFLNCAGPVPEELARALFNCFDSNSSGTLDVQQFVCGVAVILKGRPEQKLRLLFMVYDADKDHRLSDRELNKFARALSDGRGETVDAAVNSALKELLGTGNAVDYEKFECWARQHVDSPLVDWIFCLKERVRPEDEKSTSAWRMPHGLDRSNSVQEREELHNLLEWSETEGIDKELAKELRSAWQSAMTLGAFEKSAFLKTFPSAPPQLVERFAAAMDRTKTGTVSSRDWVRDLSICIDGSLEQRKDLVFRMFADDSGSIPSSAAAEIAKWAQAAASVFTERDLRPASAPENGNRLTSGAGAGAHSENAELISQALGYVARIDLKIPPPNAREEQKIIEKINASFNPKAPGKAGDVWYLICAFWWKQWLEFTSTETNSREQGPTKIDNTDLVDARNLLKFGLSEGEHYKVITKDAWHALVAWYGQCGPALARKVIEIDGRAELEMYPLRLHINRTDQDGKIILREETLEISRTALASQAKQEACALHRIDAAPVVLCHRIHDADQFEEVDESQTLYALNFLDNETLLLRFRNAPMQLNGHRAFRQRTAPCGLRNLGNTCYMNAAIQCLVHSPLLPEYFESEYKLDLNKNAKFGWGGKLATAFAELLGKIREAQDSGGYNFVAPEQFKRIFSDFKPQFAGFGQQDAHEFLSMFLEGLSEDVNWTTIKPCHEDKDSEGRPDEEVALEYWHSHCLRERSAVTAVFSGQLCSVLQCKTCGYTNKRFQPHLFHLIPLAEHSYRWVICKVVSASRPRAQHFTQVGARVPKDGTIVDLLEAVGGMLNLEVNDLVAGEVRHGYVLKTWLQDKSLSTVPDDVQPEVFHTPLLTVKPMELKMPPTSSPRSSDLRLPKSDGPTDTTELVVIHLVHRRRRMVEKYLYNKYKWELFASPVSVKLPNSCRGWRVYATAWMAVRHLVPDLMEPEDWPFLLSTVKRDGTACAYCSWREGCLGCTVPLGDEEVSLTSGESIAVDWDASILQQHYKEKFASHIHEHESVELAGIERKTSITLEQCLSSLVQDTEVTARCCKCRENSKAERPESPHVESLRFWACPPLLVLQLNRFRFRTENGAGYKLFNKVTFGLSLDLKEFLKDGTKDCHKTKALNLQQPLRERSKSDELRRWVGFPSLSRELTGYRLYGVVYHSGGYGSGHYMASVLHGAQWYICNDDHVYKIPEQDVCTYTDPYLLFYARDDVFRGETDLHHFFPNEKRQVLD